MAQHLLEWSPIAPGFTSLAYYHYQKVKVVAMSTALSLLLQVICRGNTYLHAVQKMQRALYEFHIRGVKTNILFLENVLRHPEFLSGKATTSFIDRCHFNASQQQESFALFHGAPVCWMPGYRQCQQQC